MESYRDLSEIFMKLSELEQSALGHVSTGFDAMSCGQCLHTYAVISSTVQSRQYFNIFGNFRLLARYRESMRTTMHQRHEFKSVLLSKRAHLREDRVRADRAKVHAQVVIKFFILEYFQKILKV